MPSKTPWKRLQPWANERREAYGVELGRFDIRVYRQHDGTWTAEVHYRTHHVWESGRRRHRSFASAKGCALTAARRYLAQAANALDTIERSNPDEH
jgi:hypothetical protein